jgi:predicted nucleotidyltransferase
MRTLHERKQLIPDHWGELQLADRVEHLGFFGPFARGEQAETSDVDVLVEFQHPVGLLFVHLAERLKEILQLRVGLLTPEALRPNRREPIHADLVDAKA